MSAIGCIGCRDRDARVDAAWHEKRLAVKERDEARTEAMTNSRDAARWCAERDEAIASRDLEYRGRLAALKEIDVARLSRDVALARAEAAEAIAAALRHAMHEILRGYGDPITMERWKVTDMLRTALGMTKGKP